MSESKTPSMAGFEIWFLQNYPADCILANPAWHLPKIYRAAIYEWEKALAAKTDALEAAETELAQAHARLLVLETEHAEFYDRATKAEAELERIRADLAEAVSALPQAVRNERERCARVCEASDGWDMNPKDYGKLLRALPIESAPMRRDQKLAAAGIKPRPLLNALRKDEPATPAPTQLAEPSQEDSGAQGAADQRDAQRYRWMFDHVSAFDKIWTREDLTEDQIHAAIDAAKGKP